MEERPWTKSEYFAWSDGRRIVDLYEFSKQLQCKHCCSLLDLRRTEREARYGLASVLYVVCNCGVMNDVHTGKTQDGGQASSSNSMYEINIKASINLLMYGAGASRILNFLALLDIPVPPPDDTSLIVPVTDEPDLSNNPMSAFLPAISAPPKTAVAFPPAVSAPPATATVTSLSSQNSAAPSSVSVPPLLLSASASSDFVPDDDDDNFEPGGDFEDEDDDEYVPPSKSKTKAKPRSTPARSKRKSASTPKSARAKVAKQPKAVKPKKSPQKSPPKRSPSKAKQKDKKGGEGEPQASESKEMYLDPADMSTTDTETETEESKKKAGSDGSWHEEDVSEDTSLTEGKRKRGRPSGKTSAKKKKKGEKVLPRCSECEQDFTSVKAYNTHMKRVHNEDTKAWMSGGQPCVGNFTEETMCPEEETMCPDKEIMLCRHCGNVFGNITSYREHRRKCHRNSTDGVVHIQLQDFMSWTKFVYCNGAEKNVFRCLTCCKDFKNTKSISMHMIVTADSKISCCAVEPGKKLHRLSKVLQYITKRPKNRKHSLPKSRKHYCTKPRKHLCKFCGRCLFSSRSLKEHLMRTHGENAEMHTCETCNQTYNSRLALYRHKRRVHVARLFLCGSCGQEFKTDAGLKNHQVIHDKAYKGVTCEICGKTFSYLSGCHNHMKEAHGAPELPFPCSQCPKVFKRLYNLTVHERIHSGLKPYQCVNCGVGFAQKNSLNVHMRKHGLEIQQKRRDFSEKPEQVWGNIFLTSKDSKKAE